MVAACCYCTFGGVVGVVISMWVGYGLPQVLGLLCLLVGAIATEHSCCSTHCMWAARFLGVESADCYTTAGLCDFEQVRLINVES